MKRERATRWGRYIESLLPKSRGAICFLRLTLPLILAYTLALLGFYLRDRRVDLTGANLYYPLLLEMIFAALLFTAFGVLILELTAREAEGE